MKKRLLVYFLSFVFTVYVLILPVKISSDAVSDMNSLVRNYNRTCAVMVYTEEDGLIYSYNANRSIACASLIKLPYADFVCHQISAGVRSLDERITYTSGWYHGGSGIIKNNGYGRAYTIRQLLDYMLRYSDNVAYDMLVYLFGTQGFDKMVSSWGYGVSLRYTQWPNITASFMCRSMQEMSAHRNDGECWKTAWKALNESTDVLVRSVLGNADTPVAIKYGLIEYVYHEVCYIDGVHPYILVILSGASGYVCDVGFVKKVAACSSGIIKEHFPSKQELSGVRKKDKTTGDLNGDNKADAADLLIMNKLLIQNEIITPQYKIAADLNQDGCINIIDFGLLKNILL